jgi:hypothetical protein
MSEGGGEGNPLDLEPATMRYATGALHRPAPAGTPILRAGLALHEFTIPRHCEWYRAMDLRGADGQPDALGNATKPNCVAAGAARMMQLWSADGRLPTEALVDDIYPRWGGGPLGIWTDEAFDIWAKQGVAWSDQRIIAPRRILVEVDGIAPDLRQIRAAIYLLGAVGFVFRMPETAFTFDRWEPGGQPRTNGPHQYHFVPAMGYHDTGDFIGCSWGRWVTISSSFIVAQTAQANAFVCSAWVHPRGDGTARTPSGLTLDQLHAIAPSLAGV